MASNKTTTAAGYGYDHQRLRAALLPDAYGKPCPRCGTPMLPGQTLDLDHTDDRSGYHGMAHASCNRAAGAHKRNAKHRAKRVWRTSRRW